MDLQKILITKDSSGIVMVDITNNLELDFALAMLIEVYIRLGKEIGPKHDCGDDSCHVKEFTKRVVASIERISETYKNK